jgi:hypothetical protein
MATRRSGPSPLLVLLLIVVVGAGAWWFLIRDNRPRVLLVGDSLMRQTAPIIEQGLSDANVRSEAINGTGLLSRNQYDWIGRIDALVSEFDPDVVVVSFNGNCTAPVGLQPSQPVSCDSPEFFQQWRQAADEMTKIITTHGAKLFWVTPPPEASNVLETRAKTIGQIYKDLVAQNPEVGLIDGYKALADDNGNYEIKTTGPSGEDIPLRAPDTVHFTDAGAKRFAFPILIIVKNYLDSR